MRRYPNSDRNQVIELTRENQNLIKRIQVYKRQLTAYRILIGAIQNSADISESMREYIISERNEIERFE